MNLAMLINKVRSHGRDFNGTIFRKEDIVLFLNEAIDRFIQVLPQLNNIPYLANDEDIVTIIPKEYVHLLATYATARLFAQDEQEYKATTFMNEFEIKLAEFKERVENGELELVDPSTGEPLDMNIPTDYVQDNYFFKRNGLVDLDKGVEGVE